MDPTRRNNGTQPSLSFQSLKNNNRKLIQEKEGYVLEGKPAISFSSEEVSALASPFNLTLVGKCLGKTPPKISEIMHEFKKLNLKQGFSISFLDYRHLIITLFLEEDFTKLWLKSSLFIAGVTLVLTKWTSSYNPEMDSPIVPCWITFKKLPVMLFHVEALFEIAKLIGNPLRMDQATTHRSVLTKAKVCVEVDASVSPPTSIVVEAGGVLHNVDVVYDEYPKYCKHCAKLGHEMNTF